MRKISVEIGLARLIKEGWLSRIVIKSVPLPVDLSQVRTTAGDYNEGDLGDVIQPHLRQAARLIAEHAAWASHRGLSAPDRQQQGICRRLPGRRASVPFMWTGTTARGCGPTSAGEYDLVSNASLLTTGWDHPQTDCVFILRPTKSLSLFQQMVGRGTRIVEGKENLLLLDPLVPDR